jgi:hypothetical protein
VIRDEGGGFYATQAKVFPFVVDPSMAEALGDWNAEKFGCELGLSHVHLEGDALNVVEALKKEGPCWHPFGYLIEDTRSYLSQMLSYSVIHAHRVANMVAHKLDKFAFSQLLDVSWLDECPGVIWHVILAEQDFID